MSQLCAADDALFIVHLVIMCDCCIRVAVHKHGNRGRCLGKVHEAVLIIVKRCSTFPPTHVLISSLRVARPCV